MASFKEKDRISPWLKSVLIPFWVLQTFFMVVLAGFLLYSIVIIASDDKIFASNGMLVLSLLLCLICLVLTVTEIGLFSRHKLHPITYFTFQLVKTTCWLILFIVIIVGSTKEANGASWLSGTQSIFGGFLEGLIVLLAFLGSLIYSSIIFHRHRHPSTYQKSHSLLSPDPYHRSFLSEQGYITSQSELDTPSNGGRAEIGEARSWEMDASGSGGRAEIGGEGEPLELGSEGRRADREQERERGVFELPERMNTRKNVWQGKRT